MLYLCSIQPIDIGSTARKITEVKANLLENKGVCWIVHAIIFIALFLLATRVMLYFRNEDSGYTVRFLEKPVKKDVIIFSVAISLFFQMRLEKNTKLIEILASLMYPSNLKIGEYSVLRNWWSYVLRFFLFITDKLVSVLFFFDFRRNIPDDNSYYYVYPNFVPWIIGFLLFILLFIFVMSLITRVQERDMYSSKDLFFVAAAIILPFIIPNLIPAFILGIVISVFRDFSLAFIFIILWAASVHLFMFIYNRKH